MFLLHPFDGWYLITRETSIMKGEELSNEEDDDEDSISVLYICVIWNIRFWEQKNKSQVLFGSVFQDELDKKNKNKNLICN